MDDNAEQIFERLALAFLLEHPEIQHEWRRIPSRFSGDRTDLICGLDQPGEVFATLRPHHVVVGARGDHVDFEDYGKGESDADLAREGFDYFLDLLREHGHRAPAP
jgi:hypothetical protein